MSVNIAILGVGRIGLTHLNALSMIREANIYAIYDPFYAELPSLAERYHAKILSYEEILQDPAIQAILICTPTDQHADQIEDAIHHKKAVFCEKPIDLDLERATKCVSFVEKAQGQLMLGFNRRFDPHFMHLKAEIKKGVIGKIEMVQITSRDPAPPPIAYIQKSGGLFKDMMIHDIDMVHFLLEEDIASIQVIGANLMDKQIGIAGDIDSAMLQGKSESGILLSISNSRRANYGYDQRIEVHGSEGMIKAGNVHENTVMKASQDGFSTAPYQNFFMERYHQAYINEIKHFVDAIENQHALSPNGRDGVKALRIAEQAIKQLT